MLYPSIDQLLTTIDSKYRLVMVVTQRAREMEREENYYLDSYKSEKLIGKALEEINAEIITYEK